MNKVLLWSFCKHWSVLDLTVDQIELSMVLDTRRRTVQGDMFVSTSDIRPSSNALYWALNTLRVSNRFDAYVEELCSPFYADTSGVYFCMRMMGFPEGLGSEREIAWRCHDSRALRSFLGYGLTKNPPEHSTLSKMRKRLRLEAHTAGFGWVLPLLNTAGLLCGQTLCAKKAHGG